MSDTADPYDEDDGHHVQPQSHLLTGPFADLSFFRVGTTGMPQRVPSFSRSLVESRWLDGATKWISLSASSAKNSHLRHSDRAIQEVPPLVAIG